MPMRKPNDEYYYYNSVRNQVIVFMSIFKGMKVVDEVRDTDNTIIEMRETPIDILYTPQERKKLEEDYEKLSPDSQYDMKVPIFSVSIADISYDDTRALNFYRQRRIKQNSAMYRDRMPIPYNINMTLAIVAKYEAHIHQISENIAPFLAPYVIVKIKENITTLQQIPRELRVDFDGSINRDIPIEYNDTDRRTVRSDLNFTIRGWIYKPLTDYPGPILHIPIRFFKREDFDINTALFDQTEVVGPNWNG
jgi:hypothetical protein